MYRIWLLLVGIIVLVTYPASAQLPAMLDSLPDCGFTQLLDEAGLHVGAIVLNIETGDGCAENLDDRFNVASVPKIFVAATYYDMLINGQASAATRQVFTQQYYMGGRSDCLSETQLGNTFTSTELIEYMINCSDNSATWMLMDAIGWGRVQSYIDNLGIEGIGTVIPYAEVDRLKLTFLDERWANVPRGQASSFYRRGITSGLLQYFNNVPDRPFGETRTEINQQYFDEYDYNTITPRALGSYFLQLREDILAGDMDSLTATAVFNTMLYTQRLYSTQAMPGTVYIGGKNGWDMGLLAEANVLFDSLTNRIPKGIVIVFTQYDELNEANNNLPNDPDDPLPRIMTRLSPIIREIMYPNYTEPNVQPSFILSSVTLHQQSSIEPCWWPYRNSGFAPEQVFIAESCWRNLAPRISYPIDENLAMGLVLHNLNAEDTRMVFVYTAPDGRRFSYQEDRSKVNSAAVYWYHPLDMAGQWRIDIYINLQHVYTNTIVAQR